MGSATFVLDPDKDVYICPQPNCNHLQNQKWTGVNLKFQMKCDSCEESGDWKKATQLYIRCSQCNQQNLEEWHGFHGFRQPPYCPQCRMNHAFWTVNTFAQYLSAPGHM